MKEHDRIWLLMARKLADEASDKELEELQELLRKNPEMGFSLQVLDDIWQSGKAEEHSGNEGEDAFARMQQKMKRKNVQGPSISVDGLGPAKLTGGRTPVLGMVSNAFKVSRRNLVRNIGFSTINIFGLAIGMASALLIFLWIAFQFSMDGFNVNRDRIYQVYTRAVINDHIECWNTTPMVMAPALQTDYPQIEQVARLNWVGAFVFSAAGQHLATQGFITDPAFLTIFSYPLLRGNPDSALQSKRSLVLTESMARRLFGGSDPLGQQVKVDSNALFTVTGVLKDLPHNSSFNFDYLIPWSYMQEVNWTEPHWNATTIRTYVMLKDGVSEDFGNTVIRNVVAAHEPSLKREVFLHPMRKWQLYSSWNNGQPNGGGIEYVRIFGTIAAMILLIACINYMNLSTARSRGRAREVGIRKTVGAQKGSLVLQFMGESIVVSMLAGILALILIQPGLYSFNSFFHTHLSIPYASPLFWTCAVGFIVLTGLVAGSYPALYLSAFRPMQVLKGIFKTPHHTLTPRKVLVVMQFTVAIVLIICTIVIYRQIDYAQNRNAGYQREGLSYTYIKGNLPRTYPQIREALLSSGLVTSVARTNSPITDIWFWDDSYGWKGKEPLAKYYFGTYLAYTDMVRTMGLRLTDGRDIDMEHYPGDTASVVLNETAVRLMGFGHPIGRELTNRQGHYRVVGVVKDFIPQSPYEAVPPIVCRGSLDRFGTINLRLSDRGNSSEGTSRIRRIFAQYNPDCPFEYYQARKSYSVKFADEEDLATMAAVFAGLAIFISCMGLFGLAASTAESRFKEIGVRKVLGASVSAITSLLSRDFLKWVLLSFCIASPLAWWAMRGWLQGFHYHVNINIWVFALAGVLSVVIAAFTVGFQSVRAAMGSPVKALRSE